MTPPAGPLLALLVFAATPPANEVAVRVDATLGADGSLEGTMRSTWRGACAADVRSRLKSLKPEERALALAALAGSALSGHLKAAAAIEGLDSAGDLAVSYVIESPRFAAAAAGRSLRLPLPLLAPYEPRKIPATMLPVAIVHDISIKLPAGMAPLELPSVFSTITPDAGRYVLYYDAARTDGLSVTARRELEISGTSAAGLGEMLDGVAAHDATLIDIVRAAARPRSG